MERAAERLSISAVLPAFNEAENLAAVVSGLAGVLDAWGADFEIIVVDDGSEDGTGRLAEELARREPPLRVVHHPRNLGYGAALRSGFTHARHNWIFFMDADGQFDPQEIGKLISLSGSHEFIIGFRAVRQDPRSRRFLGAVFSRLVRVVFGVKARDVNCAFKLFRRDLLEGSELRASGALINAELLALARRKGIKPVEVPVTHLPRLRGTPTGGSGRVIRRAMKEFAFLFFSNLLRR